VEEGNEYFSCDDGVLFNKDKTELVHCPEHKTGHYTVPDSITGIGNWTFVNCSSLTSITIPDSVTSIGAAAFSGCSSLRSINIPDSVTRIEDNTFERCSSLSSITVPGSVTSIGNSAFSECRSLTSITVPDSVETIDERAFEKCSNLRHIILPKSGLRIRSAAFDCSGLISVINLNPVPQRIYFPKYMLRPSFFDDLKKVRLYVPAESVELYKIAPGWEEFGTITAYELTVH
jgi:hypothetical protein